MRKNKKKKTVEVTIEFDLEEQFFRVVDYDYRGSGGVISGGYRDEQHFLDMFVDYFEKYICIELPEYEDE